VIISSLTVTYQEIQINTSTPEKKLQIRVDGRNSEMRLVEDLYWEGVTEIVDVETFKQGGVKGFI
jgi:hypothetical protein